MATFNVTSTTDDGTGLTAFSLGQGVQNSKFKIQNSKLKTISEGDCYPD